MQGVTPQHSTTWLNTAQHSTAQHSTAQHSTAQHSTTIALVFDRVAHMQGVLAALFAAGTVVTTLNTYGLSLLDPSKLDLSSSAITATLPGTLAFFALLGQLFSHPSLSGLLASISSRITVDNDLNDPDAPLHDIPNMPNRCRNSAVRGASCRVSMPGLLGYKLLRLKGRGWGDGPGMVSYAVW